MPEGGGEAESAVKREREDEEKPAESIDDSAKKAKTVPADDDSSDDEPLAAMSNSKKRGAPPPPSDDDSDDEPLGAMAKKGNVKPAQPKGKAPAKKKAKKEEPESDSDDSDDEPLTSVATKKKPPTKRKASTKKSEKGGKKGTKTATAAKGKKAATKTEKKPKKKEDEVPVFKWWLEKPLPEGQKWRTLEHKGPLFPPEYKPLPKHVFLLYNGEKCELEPLAEEVAVFYAGMLKREYVTMDVFNRNFMESWQALMTASEKKKIKDLKLCDFSKIGAYLDAQSELRKNATKEEKNARKETEAKIKEEYGWCMIDGHKQRISNFRVEPPGLFQGRGAHPKMGRLKKRLRPEDVTINVSDPKNAPPAPEGHSWGKVICDNTVSWLASWTENIANSNKYVQLAAESHLKGRKDMEKYDIARKLKKHIVTIRNDYTTQLKSKKMLDRQKATALYFIDKLALRAGGEKDPEEEADTVGCCNLRCEHVFQLGELQKDQYEEGKEHPNIQVKFDFLGKDSIRYENVVSVTPQVWKNIRLFKKPPKVGGDDLFDHLSVAVLNAYLKEFMPELTAKTFRTYNASITLQEQLKATPVDGTVEEKMLAYNRANKEVAILCNHQRSVPKSFEGSMEKLEAEMEGIRKQLKTARKELKAEKKVDKASKKVEKLKKQIVTLETRLKKKEIKRTERDENKSVALGTSKLNYLDPRISVAWCKKHDVDINKVYNKSQRDKFRWAIEIIMNSDEEFVF